jgi:hypothetical protein
LEDSPFPPEQKVGLTEQILACAPALASAHLLLGKYVAQVGRVPDGLAALRRGLACAAEPDIKTRLLVELGVRCADRQEQLALLRAAQALNGNLMAAAQAMLALKAWTASA